MKLKSLLLKSSPLLLLLFFASLIRFYNFPNRILFGPEQAISLLTSASYLKHGISLLGQPYFHNTSTGLTMFYPPQFNYLLMPLLLLFRYNPLPITAFFTFLNLATGIIIYYFSRRLADTRTALLAAFFFLFNAVMINYSLFIWGLHFFPLFGWLFFVAIVFYPKIKHQLLVALLLGIMSGIGISLEYPFAVYALIGWLLLLLRGRNKLFITLAFAVGGLIGNLPMVLFDLRHDWYYTRVLLQYAQDQLNHRTHTLDLFHFLPLWGIAAYLLSWFFNRFLRSPYLLSLAVVIYLVLNLNTSWISLSTHPGMPAGLRYPDYLAASSRVAALAPDRFNLATLWDFDTRAHPWRYLLEYRYRRTPAAVDQYRDLDALFVLAPQAVDPATYSVYELDSFRPFTVSREQSHLNPVITLYHLVK